MEKQAGRTKSMRWDDKQPPNNSRQHPPRPCKRPSKLSSRQAPPKLPFSPGRACCQSSSPLAPPNHGPWTPSGALFRTARSALCRLTNRPKWLAFSPSAPITALLLFLTWPAMIGERGCGGRSAVHPRRFLQSTGGITAIVAASAFCALFGLDLKFGPRHRVSTARHSVFQAAKHFNHPCSSGKGTMSRESPPEKRPRKDHRPSHAYAKRVLAAETSPIGNIAALKSGSAAGCPAAAGTMVRFSLQRRG